MKSPVPFLKPKSYYSSPFKTPVIRDEIVPQIDPVRSEPVVIAPPLIIEKTVALEEPVIVTDGLLDAKPPVFEEQPVKYKKPKQKLTEPES